LGGDSSVAKKLPEMKINTPIPGQDVGNEGNQSMTITNLSFRRVALAALAICALRPAPVEAQAAEQVINVYVAPLQDRELNLLDKAIRTALSQPPFQLVGKPFAGVIVLVPSQIAVTQKRVTGTYYDFTLTFTRDGSSLGESAQACNGSNLAECTDQIVQDIKSVAAR